MKPHEEEVKAWLQKAYSDLRSAQILATHGAIVLDTATFHCQQAAEKALKAFLVWRAVPFDRVHNLTYLLDLCEVANYI
jgi:HEPN domain-containing protein